MKLIYLPWNICDVSLNNDRDLHGFYTILPNNIHDKERMLEIPVNYNGDDILVWHGAVGGKQFSACT